MAKTAGVSTDTYSKGKKILDSDNEELKKEVLSGEKTINAGYKELQNEKNEESSFTGPYQKSLINWGKIRLLMLKKGNFSMLQSAAISTDFPTVKSAVQQRKWENVLKNWRGCMELKEGTTNIACRILRYPLNLT